MPDRRLSSMTTGIRATTTGVLFTKAEAKMTNNPIPPRATIRLDSPRLTIQDEKADRAPVLNRAPDNTNIAAIVHGAGLENTSNALS